MFPGDWWRTTVSLVAAIQAVPLPVTQEAVRDAAAAVITLVRAALHQLRTSQLIGPVLALRHTVAHLTPLNALPAVGALELVCGGHAGQQAATLAGMRGVWSSPSSPQTWRLPVSHANEHSSSSEPSLQSGSPSHMWSWRIHSSPFLHCLEPRGHLMGATDAVGTTVPSSMSLSSDGETKSDMRSLRCNPGCPRLPEPTAAVLVGPVQTVLLPVAQQVRRQAAPPTVTVVNTAVRLRQTVCFV